MKTNLKQFVDEWFKRDWFIRESNPKGDLDVIDEVVTRDMYGVRQLVNAPDLVLDIGAHIGSFSVLAKTLWPDCPVMAFEPNPASYELLKQNTEGMGVTCIPAGVRYGNGVLVYVDSQRSTGSGFFAAPNEAEELMEWKQRADGMGYAVSDIPVRTCLLEGCIVEESPYKKILLKLDAELAEVNILNGMPEWLAKRIYRIVGEYHCKGGWGEFMETVNFSKFSHLSFHCLSDDLTQPIGLFYAT